MLEVLIILSILKALSTPQLVILVKRQIITISKQRKKTKEINEGIAYDLLRMRLVNIKL